MQGAPWGLYSRPAVDSVVTLLRSTGGRNRACVVAGRVRSVARVGTHFAVRRGGCGEFPRRWRPQLARAIGAKSDLWA